MHPLAVAGHPAIGLSGFSTATVTDTTGGHSINVSGWTGTGMVADTGSAVDTVTATKIARYTLSDTALLPETGCRWA